MCRSINLSFATVEQLKSLLNVHWKIGETENSLSWFINSCRDDVRESSRDWIRALRTHWSETYDIMSLVVRVSSWSWIEGNLKTCAMFREFYESFMAQPMFFFALSRSNNCLLFNVNSMLEIYCLWRHRSYGD